MSAENTATVTQSHLRRSLAQRLKEIDAKWHGSPYRLAVRVVACRNHGDREGEDRELAALVREAARTSSRSLDDVDRDTMPTGAFLVRRPIVEN